MSGNKDTVIRFSARELLRAMRPNQWTKNAVVGAAYFFAIWDPAQRLDALAVLPRVLASVAIFCAVSSGVYLFNDLLDISADRRHPVKRLRPIASGTLSPRTAVAAAVLLLFGGLTSAAALSGGFAVILGVYAALQGVYSLWLKHVALVDVLLIAVGFVLRAVAGAKVIRVDFSPWLLLCAFLLALFLALCKRRNEKGLVTSEGAPPENHRPNLMSYDRHLLDQLISIVSAATIASYAMYTLSESTVRKFGTTRLGLTIPLVVFGIFRYLDLVYRHDLGGQPEKVLLTDRPLIIALLLYAVTALAVLMLG